MECEKQSPHGETHHETAPLADPATPPLVPSDPLPEKERENPTCRICLDDEECNSLIRPCHCRGTMQYVHIECLNAWRKTASKEGTRGGIACQQCHFKYVDAVKWRRPVRTLLAPVVLGIAGSILQALPFGLVLLWHFVRGVEGPHDLCVPRQSALAEIPEFKVLTRLWREVLRPLLLFMNPGDSALHHRTTASCLNITPTPLLECMIPRVFIGFLSAFLASAYHLAIRAIRTTYPPLRLAHALLEPAESLRVLWSFRSGIIIYELLSHRLMDLGDTNPSLIYVLFAALPFLLPEPLEIVVQDLGTEHSQPAGKETAKESMHS